MKEQATLNLTSHKSSAHTRLSIFAALPATHQPGTALPSDCAVPIAPCASAA